MARAPALQRRARDGERMSVLLVLALGFSLPATLGASRLRSLKDARPSRPVCRYG
jgi:hypothetical protein